MIILSVFVFREIWVFIYGMVYTVITSIALDGIPLLWRRFFDNVLRRQGN
ncbi:hypothetical protein [Dysosmobacter sp. HCP28S3_G4]